MTPFSVKAPGKVVLVGEYAVLDGAPGVVVAVDRGVRCDVVPGTGIDTPDGDVRFVKEALGDLPARHRFVFRAWNPVEVEGGKPGLGGSAAACVAACVAADRAATDAYDLHARVQGGGSGIDVAASVYGGVLLFERRKVIGLSPVVPVVVHSGRGASTATRIETYLHWTDRAAFVQEARRIVYRFMEDPLGSMQDYTELLERMVSRAGLDYWTPELRAIVALARACGGVAKPSGAGGGDSVVALFGSSLDRIAFRARCDEEGFTWVDVAISDGAKRVIDDEPEEPQELDKPA